MSDPSFVGTGSLDQALAHGRLLLESDPEAAALLDAATLDRIFDLDAALRNASVAFDRLEAAHV